MNLAAGEQVRRLPRRLASDIPLPGNDPRLIDDRLVLFHRFTGDGDRAGHEYCEDPAVVKPVSDAFETGWERGTPHAGYTVCARPRSQPPPRPSGRDVTGARPAPPAD